jgi:hypothetical protein
VLESLKKKKKGASGDRPAVASGARDHSSILFSPLSFNKPWWSTTGSEIFFLKKN